MPFFSIVIPTLNEEKFLPKLLGDLKKQTFKEFEVIHVDGSSTDQTVAKAAEFASDIALKTVRVKERNVSFQRNTGSSKAKGEWVIFMDADNRLKRTFLNQLRLRLLAHPQTDIFTCLMDNPNVSLLLKNMLDLSNMIMLATAKVRPFAAGALIGVRRVHLKNLEFNCQMKMSEDHKFVEEAVKHGCYYKVFSQPRYSFSMRRFEKEGAAKMIVAYVRSGAVLLAGPRFERFLPDYPMNGGTEYDLEKGLRGFLPSARDIITVMNKVMTKTQQRKMRESFSRLQQLINDL